MATWRQRSALALRTLQVRRIGGGGETEARRRREGEGKGNRETKGEKKEICPSALLHHKEKKNGNQASGLSIKIEERRGVAEAQTQSFGRERVGRNGWLWLLSFSGCSQVRHQLRPVAAGTIAVNIKPTEREAWPTVAGLARSFSKATIPEKVRLRSCLCPLAPLSWRAVRLMSAAHRRRL